MKEFFSYFINFFALGIQSGNHHLRMMFAKFMMLLLRNFKLDSNQDEELDNILNSCLFLLNDRVVSRKKLAIDLLAYLQKEPKLSYKVKTLLM